MMKTKARKILVVGAGGQVGTELTEKLRELYGNDQVVASDIRIVESLSGSGPFEVLDVLEKSSLPAVCKKYDVGTIYHLAAVLSAKGEQNPAFAWNLNMNSLFHVLETACELKMEKVFWPSSIAVFGPDTPKDDTPQMTVANPNTVYGISKLAGEMWCEYYHAKYGLDVRSIRYPGLIGYRTLPGGGTTDYAVDIFHSALKNGSYSCFLRENSVLPMMFMEDAIRATIEIMDAPPEQIKLRTGYNIAGFSFSPEEIAAEILKHIPGFVCTYQPDFRQKIADSWPRSIDDSVARKHWGWKPGYDLKRMTSEMLKQIEILFGKEKAEKIN